MKKLMIVTGVAVAASTLAHADTIQWNVPSGDVNTSANWTPQQVPGSSDTAVVDSGTATIPANIQVNALNIGHTAVGDVTQTAGAASVGSFDGALTLGNNGGSYGRYFLKGGSLAIPGGQPVFGNYGYGLLRMTGGNVSSAASWPTLGHSVYGSIIGAGVIDVQGGTFEQSDTGSSLCVGERGFGLLAVGGNGIFRSRIPLWIGCFDSAAGRVVAKDGGTLEIAGATSGGSSGEKSAFFSGGVLKPCGTTDIASGFFGGVTTSVGTGGLTVDTAGKTMTLAAPLADATGNLKQSNLVHRWSFTGGSLADSVGNIAARTVGSNTAGITAADGQLTLPGGGHDVARVELGDGSTAVLPDSAVGFTLEMWATLYAKTQNYDRMFSINRNWVNAESDNFFSLCWTTSNDQYDYFVAHWKEWADQGTWDVVSDPSSPHRVGREEHVAVVFAPGASGWTVTLYRHDAESSQFVKGKSIASDNASWTPADVAETLIALGYSYQTGNPDANASYNEVRIWNKALTADDLVRSAMLGPDADFTGESSLVKTGAGSLTLAAGNAYAGPTRVQQGALALGAVETPAHRWSFTDGSRADSITGGNMDYIGVTFAENKATLPGATHNTAFLQAAGVLPDCTSTDGVTLEFYATLNQMRSWQRLFTLSTSDVATGLCATWGWDTDASSDLYCFRTSWAEENQYSVLADGSHPWAVGTEYHISLVFAKTASGFDITMARRDAATGEMIVSNTKSVTWSPSTLSSMILRLGWSWDNSDDASGSFDEVRVWNRALTGDEIVAGIRAGKASLPVRASGVGTASLPSGTELSIASGASLALCGASQTVASAMVSGTVAGPGTLTAANGFFPGGDNAIGTMTLGGGATLVGDVVLDFAADGTCDQLVFSAGDTYDVSSIRLVPSVSGAAALSAQRRFVIGVASGATLTGAFDLSAIPRAEIRQKVDGSLELRIRTGTIVILN